MNRAILFLCRKRELARESLGYARAFERAGYTVNLVPDSFPENGDIRELLLDEPCLIVHTEAPILPQGLTKIPIPTACFHFDTYAYTKRRARWARLFDYAFLFHPGFEEAFEHPNAITTAHAVDARYFDRFSGDRDVDVAFVGRTDSSYFSPYKTRSNMLYMLDVNFRLNAHTEGLNYAQMADLYLRAKVGVNIARDDHPQDANLRVFEIMASGAMLVTSLPSELERMGFINHEHFAGYENEAELRTYVRHYLSCGKDREKIASAAREIVLREHTYDRRVEQMMARIAQGQLAAPARNWPESRVRSVYVDYYSAQNLLRYAVGQFRQLPASDAVKAFPRLYGAFRRWVSSPRPY